MNRRPITRPWMWYLLAGVTFYYILWLASEYGAAKMGG